MNHHGTQSTNGDHNPDPLIFSPTLLSQDAARLWMCVWHPPMLQQPEETQRKLLFDRQTSHHRKEIPDLRAQGIVYRPLIWTADGRPDPTVTRTPQHAAKSLPAQMEI